MAVDLCFVDHGDVVLPQFRPAGRRWTDEPPSAPAGRRPSSPASARPSSPSTRAAARCSSRPRRPPPRSADAGLAPRRHRRHGHLHAWTPTTSSRSSAASGIPSSRFTARTRGGGGGACATCSSPPPRSRAGHADAVLVYRAFNERSGHRFGQPDAAANPDPRVELLHAVRARHAGQGVRALVPALHARVRRHQRGLRPLHGRGPRLAGDQPERVVLRAADHARGPPGSRAGSSSRSCASSTAARRATAASRSSSPRAERAADLDTIAGRRSSRAEAATSRAATRCSTTTTTTSPSIPEAAALGRRALRRGRPHARRHRRGDDLRELQPDRVPAARGVRASAARARRGLHRRRQHRARRLAARSTPTAACSARPTSTA